MTLAIESFDNEYRFLSNFWPAKVVLDQVEYPSVENAYQAAKTIEAAARVPFVSCKAHEAKALGKKLKLRRAWDDVKLGIMKDLVSQKFGQYLPLQKKLFLTTGQDLIEGNTWNDTYWGVCRGKGLNHLGQILMDVRDTMPINLCIFGGRDFDDYDFLSRTVLSTKVYTSGRIDAIVCGMARGADMLGRRFALEHDIRVIEMPANWDLHGKRAGYVRNEDMARISHAALGFWDGRSRGTGHWIGLAPKHDVKLYMKRYGGRLIPCQMSQLDKVDADVMVNIARKPIETKNVIHEIRLAPSADLFGWYQRNKDRPDWWELYIERWDEEKAQDSGYADAIAQVVKLIRAGNRVAVACYCAKEDRCHRSLVARDVDRALHA